MKKLILIPFLLMSLFAKAEKPLDQYCGKEQYGYLYRDNLYTLPFGQGWMFQKPINSNWDKTQNGYLGAGVYKLQCPLDSWVVLVLFIAFGIFAYFTIMAKVMENLKNK